MIDIRITRYLSLISFKDYLQDTVPLETIRIEKIIYLFFKFFYSSIYII